MVLEGHFNPSIHFHVLVAVYLSYFRYENLCSCRDAARYTFGNLLQVQLQNFTREWNSHRIRPSKMAEAPSGIPNVLFEFPELEGIILIIYIN